MTSHIYMYLAYASFFVALITTERTTSEALHLQCFGSKVVCAKGSLFFVSCQKRCRRAGYLKGVCEESLETCDTDRRWGCWCLEEQAQRKWVLPYYGYDVFNDIDETDDD